MYYVSTKLRLLHVCDKQKEYIIHLTNWHAIQQNQFSENTMDQNSTAILEYQGDRKMFYVIVSKCGKHWRQIFLWNVFDNGFIRLYYEEAYNPITAGLYTLYFLLFIETEPSHTHQHTQLKCLLSEPSSFKVIFTWPIFLSLADQYLSYKRQINNSKRKQSINSCPINWKGKQTLQSQMFHFKVKRQLQRKSLHFQIVLQLQKCKVMQLVV